MKKLYDSLIFDIDGTLWDASIATAKGWTNALKQLNITRTITAAEVASETGKPWEECMEILFKNERKEFPRLFEDLDREEKIAVERDGGIFYPQVESIIQELSRKHRIFIVSNCQTWYKECFLEKFSSSYCVIKSTCHGDETFSKQQMIANIIDEYTLQNPCYVGDTQGDMNAAIGAGADFIWASYGFRKNVICDKILFSFSDILNFCPVS